MKLDAKAFALALGILWGLGVLVMSFIATKGYGAEFVSFLGNVYLGYDMTVKGAVIGAVWGFLDGFIGGWIFAWLYNKLAK